MKRTYIVSGVVGVTLIAIFFFQSILSLSSASAQNDNSNSTIAGIEINVEKEVDIQALLASEIQQWKEQPLIIEGQSAIVEIPTQYIQFNITKTVENYIQAVKNPWYKPWVKAPVVFIPLDVTVSDELNEAFVNAPLFNVDETIKAIREHASELRTTPVVAEEMSISKDMLKRVSFEIQEISVNHDKLLSLATELNDMTIIAGETFSFLQTVNDESILRDEESVNFFASVLYSVVLQADTSILERHSQHKLPNYLQPGIEVEVNERLQRDFAFKNEGQSPIIIASSVENNRLLIEFYTLDSDLDISYSVKKIEVKPRTIYRLSPTLQIGEEKVLQGGASGYRVAVYKKIADQASYKAEELISRDFYPPQHRIVLVSSKEELEGTPDTELESNTQTSDTDTNQKAEEKDNVVNPNNDKDEPQNTAPNKEVKYDKGGNIITEEDE